MSAALRERSRKLTAARTALRPIDLIVIGCSLGGMHALEKIFSTLPATFNIPFAVAQHRHSTSGDILGDHLQRHAPHRSVCDAEAGARIKPGNVYMAPANYHLMVEGDSFRLSTEGVVNYSRPSIDVLFESAADSCRSRLVAIILTGANEDGAQGAKRVKEQGGVVVVQDPKDAEAPAMPAAAIESAQVDEILPVEAIGPYLAEHFVWSPE